MIDSNLACPSCQSALQPKVLCCPNCDIKVEGPFQLNEFATLAQDDLHFLRIFVRCEGRIRDMESALGLSYPTIRARLSALKHKLAGEGAEGMKSSQETGAVALGKTGSGQTAEEPDAGRILAKLQAGEIPFDEAMKQIKLLKGRK
ncbi:MAG: DUF2089 family protein [Fibrobacteria bacterium]